MEDLVHEADAWRLVWELFRQFDVDLPNTFCEWCYKSHYQLRHSYNNAEFESNDVQIAEMRQRRVALTLHWSIELNEELAHLVIHQRHLII